MSSILLLLSRLYHPNLMEIDKNRHGNTCHYNSTENILLRHMVTDWVSSKGLWKRDRLERVVSRNGRLLYPGRCCYYKTMRPFPPYLNGSRLEHKVAQILTDQEHTWMVLRRTQCLGTWIDSQTELRDLTEASEEGSLSYQEMSSLLKESIEHRDTLNATFTRLKEFNPHHETT